MVTILSIMSLAKFTWDSKETVVSVKTVCFAAPPFCFSRDIRAWGQDYKLLYYKSSAIWIAQTGFHAAYMLNKLNGWQFVILQKLHAIISSLFEVDFTSVITGKDGIIVHSYGSCVYHIIALFCCEIKILRTKVKKNTNQSMPIAQLMPAW